MIKRLEDNDAVACINLMMKSFESNDGYGTGYSNKNEARWIKHLLHHIEEGQSNPHYFTRGSWDGDKLTGFFIASTFENYYTKQWTMDVKDCIVDEEGRNTAFIVKQFYDEMFKHIAENGGKYWRADSVRSFKNCEKYANFLQKRYNATVSLSMRGAVGG